MSLATLRELRTLPGLLGLGWLLAVFWWGVPEERVTIVVGGCSVLLVRTASELLNGGRVVRPRRLLWERMGASLFGVTFGTGLALNRSVPVAWLGVGTMLVGAWLCLDTVVAYRMLTGRPLAMNYEAIRYGQVRAIEETLTDSSAPVTVPGLADRCGDDEPTVRDGLAILRVWGRAVQQENGYVGRELRLGQRVSLRDLVARIGRPIRVIEGSLSRQA